MRKSKNERSGIYSDRPGASSGGDDRSDRSVKKEAFHFVYSDQGKTYLAEGYGACPTTGYTIDVKELYETEHAVCLHTSLMGPATGEETKEITTFPYIVVEISGTEKEVMFD